MPGPVLTPACVWRITPELVVALDERFGDPLDAYVNGSQTWLRDDGPAGVTLEWRLHPVPGYQRPAGMATSEVFPSVAQALVAGLSPVAPVDALWEGLECFPAYDDEVEPPALRTAAAAALGMEPDAWGLVDHARIGDEWERAGGQASIVGPLLDQLGSGAA